MYDAVGCLHVRDRQSIVVRRNSLGVSPLRFLGNGSRRCLPCLGILAAVVTSVATCKRGSIFDAERTGATAALRAEAPLAPRGFQRGLARRDARKLRAVRASPSTPGVLSSWGDAWWVGLLGGHSLALVWIAVWRFLLDALRQGCDDEVVTSNGLVPFS